MNLSGKALCVFLSFLPITLVGLGIRIADQNAQATARGNAFVATANNPSAIYYNPAGITQLPGRNALAGFYGLSLESEYSAPDGSHSHTRNQIHFTPQLFYTVSLENRPFSLGMGFYTPYGLGLEWPDNSTFRAAKGNITYLTANPVVAYRLHPKLSLAAGLTVNHADTELSQTMLSRSLFPPGGRIKFSGDGTDVGFNLGLLWQVHEKHFLGLSYRGPTRIEFEGRSSTSGAAQAGILSGAQPATAVFSFPQHVVAGWSFRPSLNWNLEMNVDWTDWETLNGVTLKQPTGSISLPFHWAASFFYELGFTRYFGGGWQVSGGYIFSENSVPDRSFNPVVPDSDRHIFSIGFGRKYDRFRWDAVYQFAYGPGRTVENNLLVFPITASADGRYTFASHAIALSIGYSF